MRYIGHFLCISQFWFWLGEAYEASNVAMDLLETGLLVIFQGILLNLNLVIEGPLYPRMIKYLCVLLAGLVARPCRAPLWGAARNRLAICDSRVV